MDYEFLFHATPRVNMAGIERTAVIDARLCFPQRLSEKNWFVDERAIVWSIAHVAMRHTVYVDDVFVYRVPMPAEAKRFFDRGLWYVNAPVYISIDEMPVHGRMVINAVMESASLAYSKIWQSLTWASEERLRGGL